MSTLSQSANEFVSLALLTLTPFFTRAITRALISQVLRGDNIRLRRGHESQMRAHQIRGLLHGQSRARADEPLLQPRAAARRQAADRLQLAEMSVMRVCGMCAEGDKKKLVAEKQVVVVKQ